ncbi:unnamed protein product [Cunninghamella blakesleeana]
MDDEDFSFAYVSTEELDIEVLKKEIAKSKNKKKQVIITEKTIHNKEVKEEPTGYKKWITILLLIFVTITLILTLLTQESNQQQILLKFFDKTTNKLVTYLESYLPSFTTNYMTRLSRTNQ